MQLGPPTFNTAFAAICTIPMMSREAALPANSDTVVVAHAAHTARHLPRRVGWRIALLLVLATALIGATLHGIFVEGPFKWHISVPQTMQGGLEAIALMLVVAAVQSWARRAVAVPVTVVALALYLRRHGVDMSLALDLFWLETLVAFGSTLLRRRDDATTFDYLNGFALGLAAWSAAAWSLSALGLGSLKALRILLLVAALIGFAGRRQLLLVHLAHRARALTPWGRFVAWMVALWFAVLMARTNYVAGYDSLWYGLRGEYVLIGAGTVFDSGGLVSPVHYFPKLYEMLLLPFSGLGSNSVLIGMTVLVFAIFSLVCDQALRRLGISNPIARALCVGVCISLPAAANSVLEAKPDVLAATFILLAWVHASDWLTRRNRGGALWAFGLLTLATQAKLTALPYAASLAIGAGAILWTLRSRSTATSSEPASRAAWVFAGCAVVVTVLITARTLLLTGMPTIGPDALFRLWGKLGFVLREPAGTLPWISPQAWGDIPALIIDALWQPQRLPHIVISWTSNVWLWLAAFAALFAQSWRMERSAAVTQLLALPVCAMGLLLFAGVAYGVRGGDGNYFIAAVVPLILITAAMAWHAATTPLPRALLIAMLLLWSGLHASYAFFSGLWTPGTRALDAHFGQSFSAFRKHNFDILHGAGLETIPRHLKSLGRNIHVVGDVPDEVGMRLPTRFEGIDVVTYSHQEYILGIDAFMGFVRIAHVDYVLWPRSADGSVPVAHYPVVAEAVRRYGTPVLFDSKYVLYAITPPPPHSD